MAQNTVTRDNQGSNILQTWLNRETLANFRPSLYFYEMGEKPTQPDGYNTVSWARFKKLQQGDVTTGTSQDDGVTPNDTEFNASSISATPTQYRIVVTISDVVMNNNVINYLRGAAKEVGDAMAEKIDSVIQDEVLGGDNVLYAGGNSSRSALSSTDTLTGQSVMKAYTFLANKSAPRLEGGAYGSIIHPFQQYDLMNDTASTGWLEVNKYTTPDKMYQGEIGKLFGVRIMVTPFIKTFSSNTTVYPAMFFGKGAYGVSDFMSMQTYFVPATPSDSDPVAQRRKVGAKTMFAVKRLQEDSMLRIETGATEITSA